MVFRAPLEKLLLQHFTVDMMEFHFFICLFAYFMVRYKLKYIIVVGLVVWLHILLGLYWCVCVWVCGALFGMRHSEQCTTHTPIWT